jgi:hypothetical protein
MTSDVPRSPSRTEDGEAPFAALATGVCPASVHTAGLHAGGEGQPSDDLPLGPRLTQLWSRHLAHPSRQAKVRWSGFGLRDEFGSLVGTAAAIISIAPREPALPTLRVARQPL